MFNLFKKQPKVTKVFQPRKFKMKDITYESDPEFAQFLIMLDQLLIKEFGFQEKTVLKLHDRLFQKLVGRTVRWD